MRPTADDFILLNRFATITRTVAATAHEINNALLVVSGTVELMGMSADQPVAATSLDRLSTHSAAAAESVREMVQFMRADTATEAVVDLHAIAEKAITMRAFNAKRAFASLTHTTAGAQAPVRANAQLLLQVALNLIINAEQAVTGLKPAQIQVSSGRVGEAIVLTVHDSAPPVSDDLRDTIFDPWVTTRAVTEHAGLGLTAARRIAERFRGSLTLDADGKTFALRLPAAA